MTPVYEFLLLLFSHLMLLLLAGGDGNGYQGECPPSFDCGYLGNISFPFTKSERLDCGFLAIQNCDYRLKPKMIRLQNNGTWFEVVHVVQNPRSPSTSTTFLIRDKNLYNLVQNKSCEAFSYKYTLPSSPSFRFASFRIENATLFRCNHTLHVRPPTYMFNYTRCHDYDLYYNPLITTDDESLSSLQACTKVQLPIKDVPDAKDPFTFVTADVFAEVQLSDECANCHDDKRGQCQLDSKQKFCCAYGILQQSPWKHKHT